MNTLTFEFLITPGFSLGLAQLIAIAPRSHLMVARAFMAHPHYLWLRSAIRSRPLLKDTFTLVGGRAPSDPEAACSVSAMKREDRADFPMAPFFMMRMTPG